MILIYINYIKGRISLKKYRQVLSYTLVGILIAAVVFYVAISASPAEATAATSDLPSVKENLKIDEQNNILKDKIEYNSEFMEKYKHTITDEDRRMVESIVLQFISAQYSGDKQIMYSLCTDRLKGMLKNDPLLAKSYGKDVELKLVTVSNIVKQDDEYMAFIRIEDSRDDSQFQENFYLKKSDNQFFITMVEQDK